MMDTVLDEYARYAAETARAAGAILRERFGQPHEIRFKGAIDLVTEADQAAEDLIASRLRAVSDELGVTMPKKIRRSSAGVRQAPRARPRKVR